MRRTLWKKIVRWYWLRKAGVVPCPFCNEPYHEDFGAMCSLCFKDMWQRKVPERLKSSWRAYQVYRESIGLSESGIEAAAKALFVADDCNPASFTLNAAHSGDCLKQPWACMRCLSDHSKTLAEAAVRAYLNTEKEGE